MSETGPDPYAPIHDWVDRWTDSELIDSSTGATLHADIVAATGELAVPRPDAVGTAAVRAAERLNIDRVISSAKSLVVEALGYLGAALTLGAMFVLFDVPSWSEPAWLVLTTAAGALSAFGVFRLTPTTDGAITRIAGVLGFVAAAMTAATLGIAVDPGCAGGGSCPDTSDLAPLLISIPTFAVALLMYARHRHLLTHAALGGAAVGTIATLSIVFGSTYRAEEAAFGAMLFVVSLAWIYASETGLLEPAWLGTFGAGGTTFMGLAMLAEIDIFDADFESLIVSSLITAAIFAGVGFTQDRIRVTIVGVVALLFAIPATMTEVFGLSGEATAATLLPLGIVLTVWAVASVLRGEEPADVASPEA